MAYKLKSSKLSEMIGCTSMQEDQKADGQLHALQVLFGTEKCVALVRRVLNHNLGQKVVQLNEG